MSYRVPIVFMTDNNYVVPTAVAIQSLLDSHMSGEKLELYIIADRVSVENLDRFSEYDGQKAKIHIIEVDGSRWQRYNETGYHVSSTSLLKFCIPRLLSNYEKVLYLDGDILIRGEIVDMMNIDISSYYVAAVADAGGMLGLNFHKRLKRIRYFNAGVLLFNTKYYLNQDMEDKCFDIKSKHPEYVCMDQDVLNDAFNDRVKYLPPKWNLMMYNFQQHHLDINQINIFYNTEYADFLEMKKDACIHHLTNTLKPWKYSNCYMSKEWMETFQKTPFREMKLDLQRNPEGMVAHIKNKIDDVFIHVKEEIQGQKREVEKKIEEQKRAEEQRRIEEQRRAEEQRHIEEQRRAEEKKKMGKSYPVDPRFEFPYRAVSPGSTIVLYGGGVVGKTFLGQIGQTGYCHIAAICDKNPKKTGIQFFPVITLAEFSCWDTESYDMVLIAIERREIAIEIFQDLKLAGIPEGKIKYINPARVS